MSTRTLRSPSRKPSRNPVLETLTDGRRRRLLSLLLDGDSPTTGRELADRLVAAESGAPAAEVDAGTVRAARVALQHRHLPPLADAGLVAWAGPGRTVATTDHPALGDPWFRHLVETDADGWDDVVDCLADERRRAALLVLEERADAMERTDLARAVAARERGGDPSSGAVEEVSATLYHVHLPKLADAGLVDTDGETVTYRGHPELPADLVEHRPSAWRTPTGAP